MHLLGNDDHDRGREYAERAVVLARRSRNPSTLTMATYALGWSQCADDPDTAITTLTETIRLCEAGSFDAVLAPAMCQRGVLHVTAGRLPEAVQDIRAGFERSVEIRDELTIGAAALASVAVLERLGSAEAAAAILGALDAGVLFNYSGSGYGLFHIDELRSAVAAVLPEEEFAVADRQGAAMSYDEAVVFVRESLTALATTVAAHGHLPE
jgi:hypothetical protein